MNNFLKFLIVTTIIAIILGFFEKWYNLFILGRYFEHASFIGTAFTGFIFPVAFLYIAFIAIHYIVNLKNK